MFSEDVQIARVGCGGQKQWDRGAQVYHVDGRGYLVPLHGRQSGTIIAHEAVAVMHRFEDYTNQSRCIKPAHPSGSIATPGQNNRHFPG